MANTKFPLIINGVKFQVNPTNLNITKPISKGQLATQGGIRFQIWYDLPEILTIVGTSAGASAFAELMFLKQQFETTTNGRNGPALSRLYYKTKTYKGFIDSIEVTHSVDLHERFPYTIKFQLLHGEQFNFQDFSLQPSGVVGQVTNFLEQNINAPIARASGALSSTLGKIV